MQKEIVYEDDKIVLLKVKEIVPLYEDGTFTPSYFDTVVLGNVKKISDEKIYIEYTYKVNKLNV